MSLQTPTLEAFEIRDRIKDTESRIHSLDQQRWDATVAMDIPLAQQILNEIAQLNRSIVSLHADYDATPPGLARLALEVSQARAMYDREQISASDLMLMEDRLAAAERRRNEVIDRREVGGQLQLISQEAKQEHSFNHSYYVSGSFGVFKAHCSCGWVSDVRRTSHQAVRSGAGHLRGARAAAVRARLAVAS